MLAGHYAAAFVAKGAEPKLPLWLLLLAAQLVDILWAVLVLTGAERASLDFELPSNPLVAEYMPYTHSLLGGAVCASLFGLLVWRWLGSGRCAVLAALVVLAHWFFDLPMHRPDLTLYGTDPRLGLQLWNYPLLAHSVELALLLAAFLLYWWWARPRQGQARAALIVLSVLLIVQLYAIFAPPPPNITQMAVSLLLFWLALAGLAAWLERSAAPD